MLSLLRSWVGCQMSARVFEVHGALSLPPGAFPTLHQAAQLLTGEAGQRAEAEPNGSQLPPRATDWRPCSTARLH